MNDDFDAWYDSLEHHKPPKPTSVVIKDNPFEGLDDDVSKIPTTKGRGRFSKNEKYPCQHCGGTGQYQGVRIWQENAHCFSCGGNGYFKTSQADRDKAKARRQEKKQKEKAEVIEHYKENGYIDFLLPMIGWNNFAESLIEQINKGRYLTDNQEGAVETMIERSKQPKEKKPVQFANIVQYFVTASRNLKWPKMRLATEQGDKIVLSIAGPNSKNPGHIHVTDGGPFGNNVYYGRIDNEGRNYLKKDIPENILAELIAINDDPAAAVRVTGVRTGACCLCGRELTDPDSIDRGIGPICAENWGM